MGQILLSLCLEWLQPSRILIESGPFPLSRQHTGIRLIHNNNHNHNKMGGKKMYLLNQRSTRSHWNLHSSNPLIASWQNVYSTLSNSMLPVNGKAAADVAFCIKPLKPLLHNVVCRPHFDHTDIFTSEVIPPQIYFGMREDDRTLRDGCARCPNKTTDTISIYLYSYIYIYIYIHMCVLKGFLLC